MLFRSNRPGLQRVLSMLDAGTASGVLVVKLDRLTRSVRDLGELVDNYFADGKRALLSVGDQIDTRSASGRLVLNVLVSVAQWEREACGERTAAALKQVKAEGGTLGGAALGWTRTDELDSAGRRVVVQVAAEMQAVERAVELRRAGLTLRAVAAALTAEGLSPKGGGAWHAVQVKRVCDRAVEVAQIAARAF